MKKCIGITAGRASGTYPQKKLEICDDYVRCVYDHGGVPVVLAQTNNSRDLRTIVQKFDGFILSGGGDVDPALWKGPPASDGHIIERQRDIFEILLTREAYRQQKPLLGICKGAQVLNIARGGTLISHIPDECPSGIDHAASTHTVSIDHTTLLWQIFRIHSLTVNSTHHQAVKKLGRGLRAAARAPDGIIEAVENSDSSHFAVGVQFHPERLYKKDPTVAKLFRRFIENC